MSDNKIDRRHSRSKVLATIGSIFVPGMGQIYIGMPTRGFILFFSIISTPLFFSWLALKMPVTLVSVFFVSGILLTTAIYLYSIYDAFYKAKEIEKKQNYVRTPLNQVYLYILLIFAGQFLMDYTAKTIKDNFLESYSIPSKSMMPTLIPGDIFLVDKRVNYPGATHELKRGDIAVFIYPNERKKVFIKRIVGLPNDKVKIEGNEVYINGVLISWDKSYSADQPQDSKIETKELIIPNGEVFVLGDNRLNSYDSRMFGTVPIRDIIGIPLQIWFSFSKEEGIKGFNFSRIGKVL